MKAHLVSIMKARLLEGFTDIMLRITGERGGWRKSSLTIERTVHPKIRSRRSPLNCELELPLKYCMYSFNSKVLKNEFGVIGISLDTFIIDLIHDCYDKLVK